MYACYTKVAPPNAVPVIIKSYSNTELLNPDN